MIVEYADALTAGATLPPIVVFFDGQDHWVADGFHRIAAAISAGHTTIAADVHAGDRREALLYAVGANSGHGLRRTNADKRRAVGLLLDDPEWRLWSDSEIARRCGVSQPFVGELRRSLKTDLGDDEPRIYTTRHGTVANMDTSGMGRPVQEHWFRCLHCHAQYSSRVGHICHQQPDRMAVHFSSDTPEHYTPPKIVQLVVECLGTIDLDPCSNSAEHPNVPAAQHFTLADNGLTKEWNGRIYMNPPYGREVDGWVEKLCAEHEAGRVTEAIALLPSRTDTQWFLRLRDYWCCFIEGRLTFIGNTVGAPFPSAVFYLGEDEAKFYYHFSPIGDIWQRINPDMFGV